MRQPQRLGHLAGAIGFALALQGCVVRDTVPVTGGYGYGYGYGPNPGFQTQVSVGEPSPYYVSSMPPEPLYEQMTASPGYGYAWIDGYWHWNGYEWVWVGGRWDRQQEGYVYVQPYYDNVGGSYVYTPGYWAPHDRVPAGWQVRPNRDGRPSVVAPPPGWHTPPSVHPVGPRPPVNGGYRVPSAGPSEATWGTREPQGGGEREPGIHPTTPGPSYDPQPHGAEHPPEHPTGGTYQPPPPREGPHPVEPRPERNYAPQQQPVVTHPAPPAHPVPAPAHSAEHH